MSGFSNLSHAGTQTDCGTLTGLLSGSDPRCHQRGCLFDCFVDQSISVMTNGFDHLINKDDLNWICVIHLSKNLLGKPEKVRTVKWRSCFGAGFVVVSHREPERVCRTSRSFVVPLLNWLRSVWSVQQKGVGKQSLAIRSHFRRSLGFLKSRLAQWNSALPYQKSFPGVASSNLLVYCSIVQPSPPLHLSAVCFVTYPPLLAVILLMWCVCFISPLHPHGSCITAAASLRHGCGQRRVTGDRPGLPLLWHRCTGMIKVAQQRCRRLHPDLCLHKTAPSSSLRLSKLNNSHIVTDHLSSSESQQGRSQSKYVMNRQPHQCEWYSLFCLDAMFNT